MHDPRDGATQRAEEIYQRLMREMRSDLERMRRSGQEQAQPEEADRRQRAGGRGEARF